MEKGKLIDFIKKTMPWNSKPCYIYHINNNTAFYSNKLIDIFDADLTKHNFDSWRSTFIVEANGEWLEESYKWLLLGEIDVWQENYTILFQEGIRQVQEKAKRIEYKKSTFILGYVDDISDENYRNSFVNAVVDNLNLGLWSYNLKNDEIQHNSEFASILQYPGHKFSKLSDIEGKVFLHGNWHKLSETLPEIFKRKSQEGTFLFESKNGDRKYLHFAARQSSLPSSDRTLFFGVVNDLTDVQELRSNYELVSKQLSNALKMGKMGFLMLNRQNNEIEISPSLAAMLNTSRNKITLEEFADRFISSGRGNFKLKRQLLSLNEIEESCLVELKQDGTHETFWAQVFFKSVEENSSEVLVTFKNVDELQKRNAILILQNQKLRDLAWQQSHEVRAPISRILSIVNAFDNGIQEEVLFNAIGSSAQELDQKVRQIVSRIEIMENQETEFSKCPFGFKLIYFLNEDQSLSNNSKKLLLALGCRGEINSFTNGQQFINHLNTKNFWNNEFLLFLDIDMSEPNSWFVLDQIKSQSSNPKNIKIITMSSSINKTEMERALNEPMIIEHIEKPLTISKLQGILVNVLP